MTAPSPISSPVLGRLVEQRALALDRNVGCSRITATSMSFQTMKRDLGLARRPSLYSNISRQADTEVRSTSPSPSASRKTPGRDRARSGSWNLPPADAKCRTPSQGTIAATDAEIIRAVRCCSERESQAIVLDHRRLDAPQALSRPSGALGILSRRQAHRLPSPSATSAGVGDEMPESSCATVAPRADGCNPSDPKRRRYRCLSPEAPPGARRAAPAPRWSASRYRATGRTRPGALVSPATAVECEPLR